LSKLGFSVLFLSTRISAVAYQSLLESTSSQHILVDDSFVPTAESLKANIPSLDVEKINNSFFQASTGVEESNTRLDYA
jgi:hypothetical protein